MKSNLCHDCGIRGRQKIPHHTYPYCRECINRRAMIFRRSVSGITNTIWDKLNVATRVHDFPELQFNKVELREWVATNHAYDFLRREWVESDYNHDMSIFITRIYLDKPFLISNLKLIPYGELEDIVLKKNNIRKIVYQYKDRRLISHISTQAAAITSGVPRASIESALSGKTHITHGALWYKKEDIVGAANKFFTQLQQTKDQLYKDRNTPLEQECRRCNVIKNRSCFSIDNKMPNMLSLVCKECQNSIAKIRRRTRDGLAIAIFHNMNSSRRRINASEIEVSKVEFITWLHNQSGFDDIYAAWVESEYSKATKPYVVAVDKMKPLTLGNLVMLIRE